MKITAEKQPESQVLLEIEVEPERVEKSMDQAFRRMAGKYRIPGFRPGKAPRVMFERYVGRDTLMREALEKLVPQVYEEAVKEESLDPIDQPQFEIPTFEPLLIKATVPVRPTVELGDYRELRVEREPVSVEPEQVDASLESVRRRYATVEPVERPVQAGDVLRVDLRAEIDGAEILNEEDQDLRVSDTGLAGLPGLLKELPGAEKGRSCTYTVEVPEDFPGAMFAGKTVTYHLTVREVKEEHLPDPNDDFAREVGEGFASLAALRERLESDLRKTAEERNERDYDQKVVEAIIAQTTLEYPPILVERELDHMMSEQSGGGTRASVEAALRKSGLSVAPFLDQLRPVALGRVQRSLVLTAIAEREGLEATDTEVAAELDRIAPADTPQGQRTREVFASDTGKDVLGRTVLTRKVYARLRDITQGKEVPALPDPAPPSGPAETEAPGEGPAVAVAAHDAAGTAEAEELADGGVAEVTP